MSVQCTLHSFSLRGLLKVIKVYFCSNLHQIWWKGAFLQVIEGSFIIFPISLFWAPIWLPEGVGGSNGVESHFCSNLHQIWWDEAFLWVIEGSLIIFMIFVFWTPHLTPTMGQGGQSGVNWGSKVVFAPMLPKFSGKKPFCKAFKDLSLVFRFSYF